MFGMWDVKDMGCSGCGMFGMWNVRDVGCSGCGMFGMWDVPDVGCGMWDVDLQNAEKLANIFNKVVHLVCTPSERLLGLG